MWTLRCAHLNGNGNGNWNFGKRAYSSRNEQSQWIIKTLRSKCEIDNNNNNKKSVSNHHLHLLCGALGTPHKWRFWNGTHFIIYTLILNLWRQQRLRSHKKCLIDKISICLVKRKWHQVKSSHCSMSLVVFSFSYSFGHRFFSYLMLNELLLLVFCWPTIGIGEHTHTQSLLFLLLVLLIVQSIIVISFTYTQTQVDGRSAEGSNPQMATTTQKISPSLRLMNNGKWTHIGQ